ncbi:MAG: lysophospholipid acyltransferase family protein, partial [Candidatus Omnitrophica bacterium]|nr:lysophospholipid acyltransferase family protein [Candidatus Omnitrophota bacterium]
PMDQHTGTAGSVLVAFFGQKAATATGPIVLSKRTGAPLISMFIMRKENGMHRIIVEPPMPLTEDPDHEKMLQVNVQKITDVFERYVREYPQEWGWMHRRWKIDPATHNWQKKKRVQSS